MIASFSGTAKAEICRCVPQKRCCALAECFGILLFCNSFSADGIRIVTECREFSYLLPKLFKKAFGITFDMLPEQGQTGKLVFQIFQKEKVLSVMNAFGFHPKDTLSF